MRIRRKLIIFFVLFFVGGIFFLPTDSINQRALAYTKEILAKQDIGLLATEFSVYPPYRFRAREVSLLFRAGELPIQVYIDKILAKPVYKSFLMLSPQFRIKLKMLGGNGKVDIWPSIFGKPRDISVRFNGLELSAHPVARTYGLAGTVGFTASGIEKTSATLSLDNVSFAGGLYSGILPLPKVESLNLRVAADFNAPAGVINTLELTSSLGDVSGGGRFSLLPSGEFDTIDMTISASLTSLGMDAVSKYTPNVSKSYVIGISKTHGKEIKFSVR